MNMNELIEYAEEHRRDVFNNLDDLKVDIARIESVLAGLPVDEDFRYPVLETGNLLPEGELFMRDERVYFYWKSQSHSTQLVMRPLVEYPVGVRLLCKRHIVDFFQFILRGMGLDV